MLAATIATLISVIAIATVLTLADCWLRGVDAYGSLKRQTALAEAGFVPQVESQFVRVRLSRSTSVRASRPFARRLPARPGAPVRVLGVA